MARQRGIPIITGVEMFVQQGARQCEIFTGKPAPEEEMLRVVIHALRQAAEANTAEATEAKPAAKPATAKPAAPAAAKPAAKPPAKAAAKPAAKAPAKKSAPVAKKKK